MKTISAIAAGMLVAFLLVAPAVVFAATITITTDKTSYTGTSSITYSGSETPPPSGANAVINVKNPNGVLVDTASVPVSSSTGAFSYTSVTGGTANWITGTYSVTATLPDGVATTTFSYIGITTGALQAINVAVSASNPVIPGDTIQVAVLTSWAGNGSLAAATFQTVHYHTPGGGLVNLGTTCALPSGTPAATALGTSGAPCNTIHKGFYFWVISVPGNAAPGTYFIHAWVNNANNQGQGLGSFTVTLSLATAANQTATNTALSALKTSLASVSSTLSTVASGVSGIQSTLSGFTTTLTNVQNAATAASTAVSSVAGKVDSTLSAVQGSQTYVLVVAALAAITLVLELAILVRKLS